MYMPEFASQLEQFIREAFQVADDDPDFNHQVDLFESGYVDSVGVIETLGFITDTFGIEIPDGALLSDEFTTIEGMTRIVADLVSERSPVQRAMG